jgi:hypothetical protein
MNKKNRPIKKIDRVGNLEKKTLNVKKHAKKGRKPTGLDTRDSRIQFFLTHAQTSQLDAVVSSIGFKSRSQFCTAVLEHLLRNDLSEGAFSDLGAYLRREIKCLDKFGTDILEPLPIINTKK